MNKIILYNKSVFFFPITILLVLIISSCSTTKRISDDEYLFVKSKLVIEKGKTDLAALKKYERISPNKKVLGFRFHLYLYSLANPEKEKFPHAWLKSIGEPPVIFDSILVFRTQENFKKYLVDRGYNNVKVESEVKKKRKKARARYLIDLGKPTLVNSVKYSFEDTTIKSFVFSDTVNSLIKKDKIFDKFLFQTERERIEVYLKNRGFYKFSREYVYYEVYPIKNSLKVDVNINFKQNISGVFDPVSKVRKHKQYKINNVLIVSDKSKFEKIRKIDTAEYQQHKILYFGKQIIRPRTLVGANNLLPGSMYSLKNVERTYTDYSTLGLFRYTNIVFEEAPSNGNEELLLDCKIDLAMRKRQSYAIDFSLTNSDNDIGIRGGITYNNFNIFRGGEHFQIGLSGALESLEHRQNIDNPMREIGITSKLETPKFLLPFNAERFQRKYKPRTEIQLSYNYQAQPKYTRTIANASFGYNWKGNIYNRHVFHPFDFYLVKLPFQDSAYFKDNYEGTRLENSFTNHTILGLKYSFEFNNQNQKNANSLIYILYNIESAGFLVNQINQLSGWGADSLLFGVNYFQYIKTDIDFRNYNIITPRNKLVYRLFTGIGMPYGNSRSMPFEKMYYSGGPYSMRAWGERTLGPGSYHDTVMTYNQLGDIKLEANIEYRFKVFWKMESALFLDVGNIWLLEDVPAQPGTGFKFDTFYKDLAMGVGFGFRFDFSFVLLRTDFGFKLRDPSIYDPENADATKWTFKSPARNFWDYTFQFGIGYPF